MYENTIVNYVYSYSVSLIVGISILFVTSVFLLYLYFMYNRKIKYNCNTAVLRAILSNYASAYYMCNYESSIMRSIVPEA